MDRYLNRWTVAGGWTVVTALVWVKLVPATLSWTTLAILWLAGLLISFCGAALFHDSEGPRSMRSILDDLENPRAARPSVRRN